MPKVSVIIPNYNHERYLEGRILSVINQTYKDFELICLDDASTDNSIDIINKYIENPKVRLVRNKNNSGSPFKQWNKGVAIAKGEYIWIAESDDLSDSNFLQTLVNILDQNKHAGLAYCQSKIINWNDDIIGSHLKALSLFGNDMWEKDFIIDGKKLLSSYMVVINVIPNASAVLFRKKIFETIGYADEKMKVCGDWITWAKIASISDIAYVAKHLNYFRLHENTVRKVVHKEQGYIIEYLKVIKFICINVAVERYIKKKALKQLRIRWERIVVNNPRDVTIRGIKQITYEVYIFAGYAYALLFFIIGSINIIFRNKTTSIFFRCIYKTHNIIKYEKLQKIIK